MARPELGAGGRSGRRGGRVTALPLVHAGLGLLLLAAATLKRAEVAARSLADPATAGADGWTLIQSAAEWAWGAWLLAGLYPRPTRRLTAGLFGLFAVVAATRGLAGRASCGCFGDLAVSPWATFGLDLAAVLALSFVPVRSGIDLAPGWPRALGAATVAAWGLLGGAVLPRAILAAPSAWVGGGTREVIPADPAAWVGRRCPLLDRIEAADRLDRGDWLVVLFRRNCAACRAALPTHEATARRWRAEGSPRRVALVAVPPTTPADLTYLPEPRAAATGQLDPARAWAVTTPRVFHIRDGVVAPADPADAPPPAAPEDHDAAAHHHGADRRAG